MAVDTPKTLSNTQEVLPLPKFTIGGPRKMMMKIAGMTLLCIGVSSVAFGVSGVPEIDPASGGSALALLSGALLMIRSRRRR